MTLEALEAVTMPAVAADPPALLLRALLLRQLAADGAVVPPVSC